MDVDLSSRLSGLTESQQRALLAELRRQFPIHQLELDWHAPAEMILDAIAKSGDLTQRGVKGVIADRAFHTLVVPTLAGSGWSPLQIVGDQPYDAHLTRGKERVTVQVKMQRRERGVPKVRTINSVVHWVVEVQRTRSGQNADGSATRPYGFGSFDILAVNLYASSHDWSKYIYTVGRWLIPKRGNQKLIETMQPVSQLPNHDWTDSFDQCVEWLNGGEQKTIAQR